MLLKSVGRDMTKSCVFSKMSCDQLYQQPGLDTTVKTLNLQQKASHKITLVLTSCFQICRTGTNLRTSLILMLKSLMTGMTRLMVNGSLQWLITLTTRLVEKPVSKMFYLPLATRLYVLASISAVKSKFSLLFDCLYSSLYSMWFI